MLGPALGQVTYFYPHPTHGLMLDLLLLLLRARLIFIVSGSGCVLTVVSQVLVNPNNKILSKILFQAKNLCNISSFILSFLPKGLHLYLVNTFSIHKIYIFECLYL